MKIFYYEEEDKMISRIGALILLLIFAVANNIAFAEMITFKNGSVIEKAIVEQTEEEIKVDAGGGVLATYYLDEIESIIDVPADTLTDSVDAEDNTADSTVDFISEEESIEGEVESEKDEKTRLVDEYQTTDFRNLEEKKGPRFTAFILVRIEPDEDTDFEYLAGQIYSLPEVTGCFSTVGRYNLIFVIEAEDRKTISEFIDLNLSPMNQVKEVTKLFLLKEYKEDGRIK